MLKITDLFKGKGTVLNVGGDIYFRTAFNRYRDFKPFTDVLGNTITLDDVIKERLPELPEWYNYLKNVYVSNEQLKSIAEDQETKDIIDGTVNNLVENKPLTGFEKFRMWLMSIFKLGQNTALYKWLDNLVNIVLWILIIYIVLKFFIKKRR